MNDAEFRRRAHALLASIDESWREEIGPCDLDSCADCGKHGAAHKSNCDLVALLAAGAAHQTCDCAYPPAHKPSCPAIRGDALDVAMRAARAREVAAAGGASFTTHDMSSRPVTIKVGVQSATPATHDWVQGDDLVRWPNCRVCGVIRRSDDGNGPCRGAPTIALRATETPRKEPT